MFKRAVVVGNGALGRLFATHLSMSGSDVTIVSRHCAAPHTVPLVCSGNTEHRSSVRVVPPNSSGELSPVFCEDGGRSTLVVIATKAMHATMGANSVVSLVGDDTPVMFACNGLLQVLSDLGADDYRLPTTNPLVLATTTHGAMRGSDTHDELHVRHTGVGRTFIGQAPEDVLQGCCNALPQCRASDQIIKMLWLKTCVNSILNTVAAILTCTNGAVLHCSSSARLIENLSQECCAILNREGELKKIEQLRKVTRIDISTFVVQTINGSAANRCSTLVDLDHGRSPEEARYGMIGFMVRRARFLDVPAPLHEFAEALLEMKTCVVKAAPHP